MKLSEYLTQPSNLTQAALPKWPGADQVYSRLYRLLEKMGADAWKAEVARAKKARRKPNPNNVKTDDMADIIDALNKGDEERCKGLMHKFNAYKV
jgi:DNA-binding GntR family transcriptional regulator